MFHSDARLPSMRRYVAGTAGSAVVVRLGLIPFRWISAPKVAVALASLVK